MATTDWLTILNILVAFLGVFIVGFTVFEFSKLRTLRRELHNIDSRTRETVHQSLKAAHRVISSYSVNDPDAKIALLQSAIELDPTTFNGFNALGYALLEKGDVAAAIDAFKDAVSLHPKEKSGYFDLAHAYLSAGEEKLCLKYLRRAIAVDPTSRDDLRDNPLFSSLDMSTL